MPFFAGRGLQVVRFCLGFRCPGRLTKGRVPPRFRTPCDDSYIKKKTAAETVCNRLRPPNQKRLSGLDRGAGEELSVSNRRYHLSLIPGAVRGPRVVPS